MKFFKTLKNKILKKKPETPQLERLQDTNIRFWNFIETDKQIVCKKLTYENALGLLEKEGTLIILEKEKGGWSPINTPKYTLRIIQKDSEFNIIKINTLIFIRTNTYEMEWVAMVKKEEYNNWPHDYLGIENGPNLKSDNVKDWDWTDEERERDSKWRWEKVNEPRWFRWLIEAKKIIQEKIGDKNLTPHMKELLKYMKIDKSKWLKRDDFQMEPWDDENMFIITNPNDESKNTNTTIIKYNQINDIEVLHNALANSGWEKYNVDNKQYLEQFNLYFPPQPQTNGGGKRIRNKVRTRSNRMKRKGKITRKNKITRKSKTKKNH